MKIFPLIATLATAVIFQGISYMISQAKTYRNYPEEFLVLTKGQPFGVDVYLTLVIVILVSLVYYSTVFGLRVMALGGNERPLGYRYQYPEAASLVVCGLRLCDSHCHHGHDLQGKHNPLFVWTGHRVYRPDRSHYRWNQLHGRGGQCAVPCCRSVCACGVGNGMQLNGWEPIPNT